MLQAAVWVQVVQTPQLILPKFSSHESSEIFLVGSSLQKGYSISRLNLITMPLSLMTQVESICLRRNQKAGCLLEIDQALFRELFTCYDQVGIRFNIVVAIKIFLHYTGTLEVNLDELLF